MTSEPEAATTLAECGTGDAEHRCTDFDHFVRRQYPRLVQFLRGRTATFQDAEDAAQESLSRMLRYRDTQPSATWTRLLYRVAVNVAHDQFRTAASRRHARHVPLENHELASGGRSPEDEASHQQQINRLRQAIRELPPKCRRVYLLKRVHGLSQAHVATHCGISVKTVEKHLAKALRLLRKKVGTMQGDASP